MKELTIFDWGARRQGLPMRNYKIRLVTGEVQHLATTQSLAEVKLQFLGRYTRYGLAINITEVDDAAVAKTPD